MNCLWKMNKRNKIKSRDGKLVRPHSFYTFVFGVDYLLKVTDLLSIVLITTRKGGKRKTNTTPSNNKSTTRWRNLIPILNPDRNGMATSHHPKKYHQQINVPFKQTKTKNSINYFSFLLFNLLRRRLRLKNLKNLIPSPVSTTGAFDQITASFYRLYRSSMIWWRKKGPALRDKQLHSHARALDVLIATLFKRLYNFQSFRTFFALVVNAV